MSKAIATIEPPADTGYAVMRMDREETLELVRGALDSGATSFDFDRIKVPAGGGITWEVPTLDGEPESTKTLLGVPVGIANKKAYWPQSMDESGGGSPPQCRSEDGLMGIGDPGGSCRLCPFNQFGTKGEGKACKDATHVLLIREGSVLPVLLSVPATSIKPLRQFLVRAAGQSLPFHAMELAFTLEKDKASGGQVYSRIVPSLSRRLGPEERERFRALREILEPLLHAVPFAEQVGEGDSQYGDPPY